MFHGVAGLMTWGLPLSSLGGACRVGSCLDWQRTFAFFGCRARPAMWAPTGDRFNAGWAPPPKGLVGTVPDTSSCSSLFFHLRHSL